MNPRYTTPAIALHWLMAIALAGTFAVGLLVADMPLSPTKLRVMSYHKWAGVSLFLLLLVRLGWRLGHRPPALPGSMSPWQQRLAAGGHHLLYLLMFAVPVSGWPMSSAKGFQTVWFGVLPLPDLLEKNRELGALLQEVHETLNWLLAALVAGHGGAALKHHFMDRDEVLRRMLPSFRKES